MSRSSTAHVVKLRVLVFTSMKVMLSFLVEELKQNEPNRLILETNDSFC